MGFSKRINYFSRAFVHVLIPVAMLFYVATAAAYAQGQLTKISGDGSKKALIFIHGIFGSSEEDGTWTYIKQRPGRGIQRVFWPRLVGADDTFAGVDIYTYAYSSGQDIQSFADQIALNVFKSPALQNHNELYVVAHSMGGLIVRRAILSSNMDTSRIKALYFFGAPMDGSGLANIASVFNGNPALAQLKLPPDVVNDRDAFLRALRIDWVNRGINIPTYCGYETEAMLRAKIVVPISSMEHLCNAAIFPLVGTHLTIVKPSSVEDLDPTAEPHRLLRDWYKRSNPNETFSSPAQEAAADVLIANCRNRRYTTTIHSALSTVFRSQGMTARVSQELPVDWQHSDKPRLWRYTPPKIVVIHLSCFQDGDRSPASYAERTADFLAFLTSLKDDPTVKVMVYSNSFAITPSFARDFVKPTGLADAFNDRLFIYRVDGNEGNIADRVSFTDCVKQALTPTRGNCETLRTVRADN